MQGSTLQRVRNGEELSCRGPRTDKRDETDTEAVQPDLRVFLPGPVKSALCPLRYRSLQGQSSHDHSYGTVHEIYLLLVAGSGRPRA